MTAKQYRDFPLTALWLIANRRNNERDLFSVTMSVKRIISGQVNSREGYRAMLRAAVRQRLEMYGAWGL